MTATVSDMNRKPFKTCVPAWLVFSLVILCGTAAQADDDGKISISETRYSRALPHAFYDQAMASLPHLHPDYQFLAGRRFGRIGEVVYALVCYRESPSNDKVTIQAVAVHDTRAWNLDAETDVSSYADSLVRIMESISKLPAIAGTPDNTNQSP